MKRLETIAVLMVGATLIGLVIKGPSDAPATETGEEVAALPSLEDWTSDARYECQTTVESLLKSPRTAKFNLPNSGESVRLSKADSMYYVRGSVDSQNGFGAMIRTGFECQIKRSDRNGEVFRSVDVKWLN